MEWILYRYLPKINKIVKVFLSPNYKYIVTVFLTHPNNERYVTNLIKIEKIKNDVYRSLPYAKTSGFCFASQSREIGLHIHKGKQNYYYKSQKDCLQEAIAYLKKKGELTKIKELKLENLSNHF